MYNQSITKTTLSEFWIPMFVRVTALPSPAIHWLNITSGIGIHIAFLKLRNFTTRRLRSFNYQSLAIIFMTCETPVNSPLYVDTATCISSSALYNYSGHSYVMIGNLNASDLRDSCSIELMTMITSRRCTKDVHEHFLHRHPQWAGVWIWTFMATQLWEKSKMEYLLPRQWYLQCSLW